MLKDQIRSEQTERNFNYTTTRIYTQAIVNIAINSDVRYWSVSSSKEVLCNIPNLVDIILKSGAIYRFKSFSKEFSSKFLKCYNQVHVERLNLIVVSCGESFVTTNEWACTASQVHTRAIVFI